MNSNHSRLARDRATAEALHRIGRTDAEVAQALGVDERRVREHLLRGVTL